MWSRMIRRLVVGLALVLMMGAVGLVAVPVSASIEVVDTIRVSVTSDGSQADGESYPSELSADGSTVVYMSESSNLVVGDTNGWLDVFAYDVATGATTRVSLAPDGTQADYHSYDPAISADGSTIVYESFASNLVAGDTNGATDIFAFDVGTGTTTRVSVASDGTQANDHSGNPEISADGTTIVYSSSASNLVVGDTNGVQDLFAYEVATGTTTRVSVASDGTQANGSTYYSAVSADGSTVVFSSAASNLVPGDTNASTDVFAFDVASSTTTRISVASDGTEANAGVGASVPSISADGSTIVYGSFASNLVPGDTNASTDVFAFDVASSTTTRISVASDGTQGNNGSFPAVISTDGSTIVFGSDASNLVVGDTNGEQDVFAHDVATGNTTRVSVAADGTQANGHSWDPGVSADGSVVIYESWATNLVPGDTNGDPDVFLTRVRRSPVNVGHFRDDNDSVFEADIEWMADEGITKGCNPPVNDHFCPDGVVTRGQMAAFLVRALRLSDRLGNPFADDDDSIFEADIEKLAAAGITRGCNPPVNTRFCPDSKVTREQMAAFLVRALGYTDNGGGDLFVDDDDSIFEADIDRLGTAGVTKGCNPPTNDRFCPKGHVTRGQMAAFLHRALG